MRYSRDSTSLRAIDPTYGGVDCERNAYHLIASGSEAISVFIDAACEIASDATLPRNEQTVVSLLGEMGYQLVDTKTGFLVFWKE